MGVKFIFQCTEDDRAEIYNCLSQLFQLVKQLQVSKLSQCLVNAPGYPVCLLFEWLRKATTNKEEDDLSEGGQNYQTKESRTRPQANLPKWKSEGEKETLSEFIIMHSMEVSLPKRTRTMSALEGSGSIYKCPEVPVSVEKSNMDEKLQVYGKMTPYLSQEKKTLSEVRLRDLDLQERSPSVSEHERTPSQRSSAPRLAATTTNTQDSVPIPSKDSPNIVAQECPNRELRDAHVVPRYSSEKVIRSTSVENLTFPNQVDDKDVLIGKPVHSMDAEFCETGVRNLYFTIVDSNYEYHIQVTRHSIYSDTASKQTDVSSATAITGIIKWQEQTGLYTCDLMKKSVTWYDSAGLLHTFAIEAEPVD